MVSGDTIAAIATATGRGGIAIIRISGPDAFSVQKRVTGHEANPGKVSFVRMRTPDANGLPGQVIDEGIVLCFKAPHSYTGEDVVEFQCHGGTVTPKRVLEASIAAGARLARRGEFTQRAFLNGRIDYGQAESILDLIDAKTERAADMALDGLAGRTRKDRDELYALALSISTDLEHALDIDEEELPDDFVLGIKDRISGLNDRLAASIKKCKEGRILRDGALVVLSGAPNVGKSSLMNALLAANRAIVSDIPGTTRDSIEEWLDIDGWPIRLVDTAGVRDATDVVEAEGVRRAMELARNADILLHLSDDCNDHVRMPQTLRSLEIVTKSDKLTDDCKEVLRRSGKIPVSSVSGEGLEELRAKIVGLLSQMASVVGDGGSLGASEVAPLVEARQMMSGLAEMSDLVLLGNGIRRVAEHLGAMIGATYSSDLLDSLFSRFCVGK